MKFTLLYMKSEVRPELTARVTHSGLLWRASSTIYIFECERSSVKHQLLFYHVNRSVEVEITHEGDRIRTAEVTYFSAIILPIILISNLNLLITKIEKNLVLHWMNSIYLRTTSHYFISVKTNALLPQADAAPEHQKWQCHGPLIID